MWETLELEMREQGLWLLGNHRRQGNKWGDLGLFSLSFLSLLSKATNILLCLRMSAIIWGLVQELKHLLRGGSRRRRRSKRGSVRKVKGRRGDDLWRAEDGDGTPWWCSEACFTIRKLQMRKDCAAWKCMTRLILNVMDSGKRMPQEGHLSKASEWFAILKTWRHTPTDWFSYDDWKTKRQGIKRFPRWRFTQVVKQTNWGQTSASLLCKLSQECLFCLLRLSSGQVWSRPLSISIIQLSSDIAFKNRSERKQLQYQCINERSERAGVSSVSYQVMLHCRQSLSQV